MLKDAIPESDGYKVKTKWPELKTWCNSNDRSDLGPIVAWKALYSDQGLNTKTLTFISCPLYDLKF